MATMISPPQLQALKLTPSSISTSAVYPPSSQAPPACSVSVNSVSSIRLSKFKTPNRFPIRAQASSSPAAFSKNTGDLLGDITIFTATGDPVKFQHLWDQNQGMAVVALLRHFGCPCCWELASALKESKEIFDSAGVKLIAVGVGTPGKARILAERAYDVLGLYYGVGRTFFNPASAKVFSRFETLRNAVKNYTIEATPDDRSGVLQQGGMFVFRGKELLYARKDEGTGDHAPLDDIINICCKVPIS